MDHQQSTHDESLDDLLGLLADQYCRATLSYFQDASDDVASVEELADNIRKQDHGGTERVAVQLHHATLPRLAGAAVVDYDPRSQTVRYHGHSELEALLDDISWCDSAEAPEM